MQVMRGVQEGSIERQRSHLQYFKEEGEVRVRGSRERKRGERE